MPKLTKLLIANRGEIAIRIADAAAALGIPTAAICSEDDRASLHLRVADEYHCLKGVGVAAYLDMQQIVDVALTCGCDAIHPGYGFLSENAAFAKQCEEAGLIFVGPRSETLSLFADKVAARRLADDQDVPIPRGTNTQTSLDEAVAFMRSLGPDAQVMLKAIAGGGGRGMRVVRQLDQMEDAFAQCRAEATSAFGQGALYVEELIGEARHVEVQILGDAHGHLIHLWDRECSLQRRHQKLIEIAPCLPLAGDARQGMIEAALKMAGAVGYRGLGTFEFLVGKTGQFWFMEANPRLQVEHTVTEAVTGVDLVQAQLRVVGGESLSDIGLEQGAIPDPEGYAIQSRINMEAMSADGVPSPSSGVLQRFELPTGPGVRVDTFGYQGYQTSTVYDSLLAKVIVHSASPDFADAVRKSARALSTLRVEGVSTNVGFLRSVLMDPAVRSGAFSTRFIETHMTALLARAAMPDVYPEDVRAGAAMADREGVPERPLPDAAIAIRAPMQGMLMALDIEVGAQVTGGQQIGLVEAMKMQMPIVAPVAGDVLEVRVQAGDQLASDAVLVVLRLADAMHADQAAVAVEDLDRIRPELARLQGHRAAVLDAARPDAVARRTARGKRMVRENLADFFDDTRYSEFGSLTIAAQKSRRSIDDLIRISPADGLIAAIGSVNAQDFSADKARCMALAYDYTVLAGTQGINSHRKKDRMLGLAAEWKLPVMVFAEGGGGRPGDTDHPGISGLDSMTFHRLAALNGKVPIIGVATGRCFAGNAALLGCCDVIIATRDANIGMAGPAMIEGGGLGIVRPEEVGPTSVQTRNGVIDVLVETESEAIDTARRYLAYFQGDVTAWDAPDPRILRHAVPENRMHVYDIRALVDGLADVGTVMELRPDFATPLLTFLARIEGRAIGLIANNSRSLGGAIDADCADKATRFMQLCNAFGVPVVSLCDTPGFMVGPDAEETALVRHVSRMFVTGAALSVPMVTIVLRKAYGLGAMAMAAGSFHAAQATLSWPTGEFGGMGLEGAVRLAYRAELAQAAEGAEREALFRTKVDELYEEGQALNVARALEIDDVIDPAETRTRIIEILVAAGEDKRASNHTRIDTW